MKILLAELEEEAERNREKSQLDASMDVTRPDFDAAGLLAGYYGLLVDHVIPLDESFATAVEVSEKSCVRRNWYFLVDVVRG